MLINLEGLCQFLLRIVFNAFHALLKYVLEHQVEYNGLRVQQWKWHGIEVNDRQVGAIMLYEHLFHTSAPTTHFRVSSPWLACTVRSRSSSCASNCESVLLHAHRQDFYVRLIKMRAGSATGTVYAVIFRPTSTSANHFSRNAIHVIVV